MPGQCQGFRKQKHYIMLSRAETSSSTLWPMHVQKLRDMKLQLPQASHTSNFSSVGPLAAQEGTLPIQLESGCGSRSGVSGRQPQGSLDSPPSRGVSPNSEPAPPGLQSPTEAVLQVEECAVKEVSRRAWQGLVTVSDLFARLGSLFGLI